MPNTLRKNLHQCFSKIKRPWTPQSPPNPEDHNRPFLNTVLVKNFNTLYDSTRTTFDSSESTDGTTTPDFATVYASRRFFFSSPGRSNSIVESAPSMVESTPSEPSDCSSLVRNSIAVPKYSPDPYMEFRRSMEEMVEARKQCNWEYLHELLLCYLALNPKSTHNFIVAAFSDLLVSLMPTSTPPPESGGRECEFAAGRSDACNNVCCDCPIRQ